jgi:hypothetical protein
MNNCYAFIGGDVGPWRVISMTAPENAAIFDELVARLRATREWTYVEREIDIRLERG